MRGYFLLRSKVLCFDWLRICNTRTVLVERFLPFMFEKEQNLFLGFTANLFIYHFFRTCDSTEALIFLYINENVLVNCSGSLELKYEVFFISIT